MPAALVFGQQDTVKQDPVKRYAPQRKPVYTPPDRYGDPFSNTGSESPMMLKDPPDHTVDVAIDTAGNYTVNEKVGDIPYRPQSAMTFSEYRQYQERQMLKSYWRSRAKAQDGESAVSGRN